MISRRIEGGKRGGERTSVEMKGEEEKWGELERERMKEKEADN